MGSKVQQQNERVQKLYALEKEEDANAASLILDGRKRNSRKNQAGGRTGPFLKHKSR